jgi:alkylation response protein AidB-like acyl-CoA dehydrogenase
VTYTLSPDVESFREEVREFLAQEFDPEIPDQGPFPQPDTREKAVFLKKLAAKGWLGLSWPAEYGGRGLPEVFSVVLQEELEYARMPSLCIEIGMIGRTLIRNGSEALKREFLPRIIRAEISMALGYSEPQAGSDLAGLELRADRDGDEFVVNGQKMWTSGAHFADYIWLACRTQPGSKRHQGITLMIVDNRAPGMEIQRIDTMGDHQTNMVYFNDVRVPASRVVGEVDRGWSYIVEALDYERLQGLGYSGLLRDTDELIAWARADDARWNDKDVRRLIARTAVRTEAVRCHLLNALEILNRDEVPTIEATMLKVAATETRLRLAD